MRKARGADDGGGMVPMEDSVSQNRRGMAHALGKHVVEFASAGRLMPQHSGGAQQAACRVAVTPKEAS